MSREVKRAREKVWCSKHQVFHKKKNKYASCKKVEVKRGLGN